MFGAPGPEHYAKAGLDEPACHRSPLAAETDKADRGVVAVLSHYGDPVKRMLDSTGRDPAINGNTCAVVATRRVRRQKRDHLRDVIHVDHPT